MKNVKVSLLALSVLAGGSFETLAAGTNTPPGSGSDYRVLISWNSNATTTAAPIFYITDAPVTDATNGAFSAQLLDFHSVFNDGSGKIDGAAIYRVIMGSSGTNVGSATAADLVCTVSGNVTLKGTTPTVTLNIRGNGTSIDSTGTIGNASMSLKFVGQGSSSTNNGDAFTGTFSGTVNTGLKGVKPFKVDPTTSGSAPAIADPVILDGEVVQSPNSKFYTMANIGEFTQVTGNGSINTKKNTFTANTKGFGFSKGASLKVSGTTLQSTNLWVILGNTLTNATIVIPGKADANGKIAGQAVKATGAPVISSALTSLLP